MTAPADKLTDTPLATASANLLLTPNSRFGLVTNIDWNSWRYSSIGGQRVPGFAVTDAERRSPVAADLLIGELSHAAVLGLLDEALKPHLYLHVLVLDEVGYLTHAADAAYVLYRVVNERYLLGLPILVTTNKPLAAWRHVLHDRRPRGSHPGSAPRARHALGDAGSLVSHAPP